MSTDPKHTSTSTSTESVASIASITKHMKWLVFVRDPRAKSAVRKRWKLVHESVGYVDAFMQKHNPKYDGLVKLIMVASEPAKLWEDRLNDVGESSSPRLNSPNNTNRRRAAITGRAA